MEKLLENEQYSEAVLNAFKYLDKHLQTLLDITDSNVYGEELINKAFAPSSGSFQLDTHANEQIGLRNFFSGANALFRNPTAHRFTNFREEIGTAIIVMVGMMAQIATDISKNRKAGHKISYVSKTSKPD